ncbi:MAG: methyltransferase domain-containing protein [Chitinispirillaceae bacterium]|nr:methyltransferase domain-containing protein [Chitinispirillaceae bacterium]
MIAVSKKIFEEMLAVNGRYAESLSGVPAEKIVEDMFNEQRAVEQIELLKKKLPSHDLSGKKFLELGSGAGIVNIVSRKKYGMDAWGLEPDSNSGGMLEIGKQVLLDNGLSNECLLAGKGECLPFENNTFDIVFSENVLEHVDSPEKVLAEAIRVCKTGGTIHMVFPNYGSFFDGHYASFHIPYQPKWMNRLWVRHVLHRDTSAVDGSRTEINYFSVRHWIRPFIANGEVAVCGFGEDIFKERMKKMNFSTWAGLGRVKRWVAFAHRLKIVSLITALMIVCKAYTPIILTLEKK